MFACYSSPTPPESISPMSTPTLPTRPPASVALLSPSAAVSLVETFLSGKSPRTRTAYQQDLESFRSFLGSPDLEAAAALLLRGSHGEANALALSYRTSLRERGLAPATINRRLAALRSLVGLARTLGLVHWTLEVESLKAESYRDTRGPGREGYRRMLALVENSADEYDLRAQAILRLLYDLGLRRAEVVALNAEDVDLERGTLQVLGKVRRRR